MPLVTVDSQPLYGLPGLRPSRRWEAQVAATPGLVGWWRMNELAGTSLLNSVPGGDALALSGGYTLGAPGPRGLLAVTFATNGYATIASTTGLPGGATPRTVGFWFKTTSVAKQIYFNYGEKTTAKWWGMLSDTGEGANMYLLLSDSGLAVKGAIAAAVNGQWHWALAHYDGASTSVIYMDGGAFATGGRTLNTGATATMVAKEMNVAVYFNGSLCQITIWNRKLSVLEINALWNAGR